MAEYEMPDIDALMEWLNASANKTLKTFLTKKDFDSAIDHMELMLEGKNDVDKLFVVNNMRVSMYYNKLYNREDKRPYAGGRPSLSFTKAFGKLGKQLEEAEGLRTQLISGSVGGLVINLIKAAVFIAILAALWLVPPVTELIRANPLLSGGSTVWLLTIIVFFMSGFSFSTAFGSMFLFWVAFVAVFGVGQYFVPEDLQIPLAVILIKVVITLAAVICILDLSGPIRRNFLAVANAREQRDIWERYSKARDALCRRCDDLSSMLTDLHRKLNDDNDPLYTKFCDAVVKKDGSEESEYKNTLNHSVHVMRKYYEYIKEQV